MADKFERDKLTPEQQEIYDFAHGKAKGNLEELQKQNKEYMDQLAKLQDSEKLTKQEREELKKKIEEFETRNLTEKQKTERDIANMKKKFEDDISAATKQAEHFKSQFINTLVETELTQLASKENAYNPKQVVGLLRGDVHVEEVLKDGKPTGRYATKLKRVDDKGIEDLVSLEDGVKAFLKENANLLKSAIIKDDNKRLDGVIITGKDGTKQTLDREAIRKNPALVNDNFAQVVEVLATTE